MSNAATNARFLQAVLVDVGGTLYHDAIEGTPTSATAALFDESGDAAGTPSVTVTGDRLSCTVSDSVADEVGETYRVRWSYTAGGIARVHDRMFAVKKHIATHTLSSARFVSEYFPILANRWPQGQGSHATAIETAWAQVQNLIRARGLDPHRIIDTAPLEPVIAAVAAANIARNLTIGGASVPNALVAMAQDADAMATVGLDRCLAAVGWYDDDQNLKPGAGETKVNLATVRLSR